MAVEPQGAPLLSGGKPGQHQIPGIGVGFIPEVLDRSAIDEVIAVSDEDAFLGSRRLASQEGILAGASSGAVAHAALMVAGRPEAADKTVVALLADSAERYISSPLFAARP